MDDCTVVFGDLVKSETSKIALVADVLKCIEALPNNARFKNTWGDAFVVVFDSASSGLRYALTVRDRLRLYDWRTIDIPHPPLLRIALAAGPLDWKADEVKDCEVPEGGALVLGARMEPITGPGEVSVTQMVHDLAGESEFFYENLGLRELPKGYGEVQMYRAYWAEEGPAISVARYGPLLDEQYYRRAEAMRRFAYLWLLLDQLPSGSWGRSILSWMNEVWRDIPTIVPNPLIEDEGGFESTILNLELLTNILGPENVLHGVGGRAIQYLERRHGPRGFGTLGLARQGYSIEPHPRHTALAGWFIGKVLKSQAIEIPSYRDLFRTSALALFGGNPTATSADFQQDRNPLLLYLASWHVAKQIQSQEWLQCFSREELQRMQETWEESEKALLDKALAVEYKGLPARLAKDRGNIYPLTVPYGGFARMEAYSLLSAAMLVDVDIPIFLRRRIGEGVKFIINHYLEDWPAKKRYKSHDRLQPVHGAPYPYYTQDPYTHPDIGTAAMLLRVLRTTHVVNALWDNHPPELLPRARYFLDEDLVQLFDRYLCDPKLYSLTHAGMLAGALVGDGPNLLRSNVAPSQEIAHHPPPDELTASSLDEVLSERKIEELIARIVADDGKKPRIQLATHSLARLLLDKLRPGRYIKEAQGLSDKGVNEISERTMSVYRNCSFVEKYNATWGEAPDSAIIAPFLRLISPSSNVLDVGCGPGQYAVELVKAGHKVTLVDASSEFLKIAAECVRVVQGSQPIVLELDVLKESSRESVGRKASFDAIWCSGLFPHIPSREQPKVLKWFNDLLCRQGCLFVNISLNNPRIFASDGRYFRYASSPNEFEVMMSQCGFQIEYMLQRAVHRNTYREPFFETIWANYYARKSPDDITLDIGDLAAILTSLAYARSADDYLKSLLIEGRPDYRAVYISKHLDKMKSYLEHEDTPRVLDAGCGPGDYVIEIARRGWHAVGIDISERWLDFARRHCPQELQSRATFTFGDIRELPEEWTEKFDAVLCITALQHVPLENENALNVLSNFARVLRPNGILRIDIQLGRGTGFDPDLRFIQGVDDPAQIISILNAVGLELLEQNRWELEPGQNTFRRLVTLRFVEFWARKRNN